MFGTKERRIAPNFTLFALAVGKNLGIVHTMHVNGSKITA
jgi:hypothetical protein